MNNKFMKNIFIKILIMLLFIFPILTCYMQGGNMAYAVTEAIIMQGAMKFIPTAGLMYYQVSNPGAAITQEELQTGIEKVKDNFTKTWNTFNNSKKALIAAALGYGLNEINNLFGTSFTDKYLNDNGINSIKNKLEFGGNLTGQELGQLGIPSFALMAMREEIGQNYIKNNQGILFNKNSKSYSMISVSEKSYWRLAFDKGQNIVSYFPCTVKGTQLMKMGTGIPTGYLLSNQVYYFMWNDDLWKIKVGEDIAGDYYKTVMYNAVGDYRRIDPATIPIENATKFLGEAVPSTNDAVLKLEFYQNGAWSTFYTSGKIYNTTNTVFLQKLRDLVGIDLTTSPMNGKYLYQTFPSNWVGLNITFGNMQYAVDNVIIPNDVMINEGQVNDTWAAADAIIQAINALGEDIQSMTINVNTYENEQGMEEITAIGEGVAVDTGAESIDYPDTGANTGEGWFNIPILGTMLQWLIKIWEMIKAIFDAIVQAIANPTPAPEPGTDWGNFKNFFDIFWIFYYLIILAIIILLKFFSIILSLMSIPANTALFDSYPTILSGLNYIKSIKVGGFNVTLQQIFEYMFTVFFFLYIVTTLQKLYHSFQGIERQSQREVQREERRYDSSRNYQYNPSNIDAPIHIQRNDGSVFDINNDELNNIKITDYTKGGD